MVKRLFPITLFIFFSILTLFAFISNTKALIEEIIITLKLWLYYVYPSIFIFYIISNTLLQTNLTKHLIYPFKPFIKLETTKAYELLLLSLFVGNPTTASLISQELQKKKITYHDANKLLREAAFFNPLFILSLFSFSLVYNKQLGFLVIMSIFITNILFLMTRSKTSQRPTNLPPQPLTFQPELLFASITQVMSLLINVAGVMVFCNVLKFGITELLNHTTISTIASTILVSIIEVTSGGHSVLTLFLPLPITLALVTFLLAFQGISINLQVYTIIKKDRISYLPILSSRFIQAIFAGILTYVLTLYFYT